MAETVLSVEGLSVSFGGVLAVDNVSFSLKRQELHCLIGPNGAGKSTFFKAISGVVRPSSGRVWINGYEATRLPAHRVARLGVGIKMQVPNLLEGLSVEENLWIAARCRHSAREADDIVETLMNLTGIEKNRTSLVSDLAHGHRQHVELASALATKPSILLLDEPAAGLSETEVDELSSILQQLKNQTAILVVEHNTRFVRMIAESVTVFHKGRILTAGSPDQVFQNESVKNVYLGRN